MNDGVSCYKWKRVSTINQTSYNINNSSLVGSQIGTTNSQLYFNQDNFSEQINKAVSEIREIAELSDEYKDTIIGLLEQINTAIQSNNQEAQIEAKSTLEGMLRGIGNASVKVISVLSGLTDLANFFGFPNS